MKKRKIFIGDVHGCFDELMQLVGKVSFDEDEDELFFVGDLINKGPRSKEVLDFVMNSNAQAIQGNHERGFVKFVEQGEFSNKHFKKLKDQLYPDIDKYISWIKKLPLFIEQEDFVMVHAGVSPAFFDRIDQENPKVLTTIRTWDGVGEDLNNKNDPAWFDFYQGEKLFIFGHWAQKGLVVKENVIGLDSGCLYGNQLSALVLPSREIHQIQAAKNYFS